MYRKCCDCAPINSFIYVDFSCSLNKYAKNSLIKVLNYNKQKNRLNNQFIASGLQICFMLVAVAC